MPQNNEYTPNENSDFSGGINTSKPPTDIADNECADILNHQFDKSNGLVTRFGVSKVNATPSNFNSRITSIFGCCFGSATSATILLTSGSKVYIETIEDTFTDVTGSATLPNDTFWSWKQFNDLAIGCNGMLSNSGYTNPVAFDGVGNIRQLKDGDKNAPGAKYCAVWNNRLFLVNTDNPNLVYYSKLGDPENFTADGGIITVDRGDGDYITGLYATKLTLFIFKRTKIYRIVTGNPNTDDQQWSVDIFTDKTGGVSNYTIQSFLDDAIFLSNDGVINLQASIVQGDFKSDFISRNVPELTNNIKRLSNCNQFASVINTENSEYWVALPSDTSGSKNGVVWILDYKRVKEGVLRWSKFDGLVVGVSYALIPKDGINKVYIGSDDGNLYYYDVESTNDNTVTFTKRIITKSFNFGTKLTRKKCESFGVNVINKTQLTTDFRLSITYEFDNDPTLTNTLTMTKTESLSGSVWGETTPSIGTWANLTNSYLSFISKMSSDIGKCFNSVRFIIEDTTLDKAYIVENVGLWLKLITARRSDNTTQP